MKVFVTDFYGAVFEIKFDILIIFWRYLAPKAT